MNRLIFDATIYPNPNIAVAKHTQDTRQTG